jgi:hypothetical protein
MHTGINIDVLIRLALDFVYHTILHSVLHTNIYLLQHKFVTALPMATIFYDVALWNTDDGMLCWNASVQRRAGVKA